MMKNTYILLNNLEDIMVNIKISDFSQEAASQTKGLQLRKQMENLLKETTPFSVDFDGISRFASPFFNNSFASLALIYGFDVIENIDLLNLSEIGTLAYSTSMENAHLLSNNPDYIDKINNIINTNLPKKAE